MHQTQIIILAILMTSFTLVMYFLPTIIAFLRKHNQRGAIFLLNFLLGWTVIGWIVSIVWAMTNSATPQTVIINQSPPGP